MAYDEFFTDQDKPFAENLNDSLVLTDAFDISVPVEMPTMFSNGQFNSALNVTRKCNVGLVTLKSVDNGVTIGTDSISGTGSVVFRIYPNFNCFYKWDKILLEKSGTVDISFRKVDGTEITASVGSDGVISDNSALKQLQEIDVVFTLTSATINNILIWFVNNQGTRNRTGACLEASQLVNVNGTVTANDDKAVNGGTVKTALDNLHTTVTGELDSLHSTVTGELEDLSDSVTSDLGTLNNRVTNEVNTLSNSINSVSTDVQTKYKQLLSYIPCMILTVTGSSFNEYNNNTAINGSNIIVDYGDGTIEPLGNRLNHSYTDGLNTHTIKIYGVTSLGVLCFYNCTGLTSIEIPSSVTSLGNSCIRGCTGLTSIEIPSSVTSLGDSCFYDCTGLTSITIPSSVTSLAVSCFERCTGLTQIYLNWSNSSKIITYKSNWINSTSSNLKFYIPIGTTSAYTSKGYPSDKLQE